LCGILKVEVPEEAQENQDLPAKLLLKNHKINGQMKRVVSNPMLKKETVKF
jgi:hypothetical protein